MSIEINSTIITEINNIYSHSKLQKENTSSILIKILQWFQEMWAQINSKEDWENIQNQYEQLAQLKEISWTNQYIFLKIIEDINKYHISQILQTKDNNHKEAKIININQSWKEQVKDYSKQVIAKTKSF